MYTIPLVRLCDLVAPLVCILCTSMNNINVSGYMEEIQNILVYIHCDLKVSTSQAKINENFANYFFKTIHLFIVRSHLFIVRSHLFIVRSHLFIVRSHLFIVRSHSFIVRSHLFIVRSHSFIVRSHIFLC